MFLAVFPERRFLGGVAENFTNFFVKGSSNNLPWRVSKLGMSSTYVNSCSVTKHHNLPTLLFEPRNKIFSGKKKKNEGIHTQG